MKRRQTVPLIIAGLCAVLAGCADYLPVDAEGNHTATPPNPPIASSAVPATASSTAAPETTPTPISPPSSTPDPVASSASPAATDTCGAAELQYLVGKPKTEIPVPVDPGRRRVVCDTCIISHLDDPARQTIVFDQASGRVTRVICQ